MGPRKAAFVSIDCINVTEDGDGWQSIMSTARELVECLSMLIASEEELCSMGLVS